MNMEKMKQLFEDGSLLHRDYNGYEQMLMNEGTFIALCQQQAKEQAEENKELKRQLNLKPARLHRSATLDGFFCKDQALNLLRWLSSSTSPYAILYGNDDARFCTNEGDVTSEDLYNEFLKQEDK